MSKNKTTETSKSVAGFINAVADETKRNDSFRIIEIMKKATSFDPKMWGPSIVGFGSCHYKYASGHEGDMPIVGFSPRKPAIVLYLALDFDKKEIFLKQFGKHKTGKGCIYIKKLEDINIDILKEMINASVKHTKSRKDI
jgi:hypothetical protein